MADGDSSFVVLTEFHSIAGSLPLREQRLSDFLNDRRKTVIRLHDVTITRLDHPSKVTARVSSAVINEDHTFMVFESVDAAPSKQRRPYAFTLKQSHAVHLIVGSMAVRGVLYASGNLDVYDLHRLVATSGE